MLLHSIISQSPPHPQPISLPPSSSSLSSSSSFSNSANFPSGFRNSALKRREFKPTTVIRNTSSFSQGYSSNSSSSYGTVDYEKKSRTPVTWKAIYKRISMMGNREKGSTSVLNQWENEGRTVTKWELCRLVKELRKYGRYRLALEVYEWMKNKPERFIMAPSDAAIQLDLISKVEAISGAEDYFKNLPGDLIDNRVYGALLNAYVHARMKEKAESLLAEMKEKDYANHALPYNVIMTLYMNLQEHEKVEAFISEMMQNNIDLDLYSYSIWITSRGSQGSVEKMEEVFEKMKLDVSVKPNWTTYSTLATVYIKLGELKKADECLKKIEDKISGRYRIPYHYLLSHYGSIGKKEEVQRIWATYKTIFPYIPNMGYHAVISAFIRMDEIEESEMLYEEWLSVKTTYDARIGNRLLSWYVRNGHQEKTESFFKEMVKNGKANSSTWEILAEGHLKHNRISDALSCFGKAFSHEESSFWKPKSVNIISFFKICEQENDERSKETFFGMLKETGVLEDEYFISKLPFLKDSNDKNEVPKVKESEDYDDEDADTLLNELEANV